MYLTGGDPLVRRGQRDRNGPRVGASLGSIAFLVHTLEIADGHVEPLDRSGMRVAAPHRPMRQRHRESTGAQPATRRDRPPDSPVAGVAVHSAVPSGYAPR